MANHCYDVCLGTFKSVVVVVLSVVECLVWGVAEQLVCVCIAQSTVCSLALIVVLFVLHSLKMYICSCLRYMIVYGMIVSRF